MVVIFMAKGAMLRKIFDLLKKNAWAEKLHAEADTKLDDMVESLREIVWAIEEQANQNPVINYIAETQYSEMLLILLSLKIQNKLPDNVTLEHVRSFLQKKLKADPDLESLFERTDTVEFPEIKAYHDFNQHISSYKKNLSDFFNDIAQLGYRLPKVIVERRKLDINRILEDFEADSENIHTKLLYRHLVVQSIQRETELNLRNRLNHALREYYKFFEGCVELDAEKIQSALDDMPYDELSLKVFLTLLETTHINGQSISDFIDDNRDRLDPDYTICSTLCDKAMQNAIDPIAIVDATRPFRKTVEFVSPPC